MNMIFCVLKIGFPFFLQTSEFLTFVGTWEIHASWDTGDLATALPQAGHGKPPAGRGDFLLLLCKAVM